MNRILISFLSILFICSCAGYDFRGFSSSNDSPKTQKPKYEGVYNVQAGAFKNVDLATAFTDELDRKKLDAFLFKENGLFKVRFGRYKTFNDAKTAAKSLVNSRVITDYYIVSPEELSYYKSEKLSDNDYLRNQLVKAAHSYKGVPYKWGGNSVKSGFDCSGLTRAVYRLNGLDLPRVSRDQYRSGKSVKISKLQKGDLVFFMTSGSRINHVGVYIGDGKFIHAPSAGKTVRIANLHSSYWKKVYQGSRTYL